MLGALSRLRSWELDHNEDDVRGWPLRDESGNMLGTVDDLIVDTDTQYVAQVVLSDGRKFPAHDVFIGDGIVTLGAEPLRQPLLARKPTIPSMPAPARPVASTPARPVASPPQPLATPPRAVAEPVAVRPAPQPSVAPLPSAAPMPSMPPVAPMSTRAVGRASEEASPTRPVKTAEFIPTRPIRDTGDLVIPIVDEELEVGKRVVESGGVRVHSHMTERPVEKTVRLREERVIVERRPVDRPLSAEEAEARFHDGNVEMKAVSEVPIVSKRSHVVEEIFITKNITERIERVRDTVRHTEAEVTELPASKREPGTPK